jgi:putative ABC transport system substrate-binding protein
MDRRAFITMIGGSILAGPHAAEAQLAEKIARVGFLVMAPNPGVEEAFPRGLRDLGYRDARDVVVEWRSAEGHYDRMPALAAELLRLHVDVIVAGGPEARRAAMEATSTIPIVVVGGSDPVEEGWAVSLARPGGNVTGLTATHPGVGGKKLELLKEMIPGLARVAVIWDPGRAGSPATFASSMRAVTRALGLDLQMIEVRQPADFDRAFQRALRDKRQAVSVVETAMVFAHRAEIAERARKARLAAIGEWRPSADAGYLVTYGADLADLLRRAAVYVDKILKGGHPGNLPIERPSKFDLVINLKTAKALGLTVPQSVLLRTDQVIQ